MIAVGYSSGGLDKIGWASYGIGWFIRDARAHSTDYVPIGSSPATWPGGFEGASKLRFYEGKQVCLLKSCVYCRAETA